MRAFSSVHARAASVCVLTAFAPVLASCFSSGGQSAVDAGGVDAAQDRSTPLDAASGADSPAADTGSPQDSAIDATEASPGPESGLAESGADVAEEGPAPDAGTPADTGAPEDVAVDTAVADAPADGGGVEAGACLALAPDGACNAVPTIGVKLQAMCSTGNPPSLAGGTIVNGTYALTEVRAYGPSCSGPDAAVAGVFFQGTAIVNGACFQYVSNSWDSTSDGGTSNVTGLLSVSGNEIGLQYVCGGAFDAGTATVTYSATATTLVLEFDCPASGCGPGQFPYTETFTLQ